MQLVKPFVVPVRVKDFFYLGVVGEHLPFWAAAPEHAALVVRQIAPAQFTDRGVWSNITDSTAGCRSSLSEPPAPGGMVKLMASLRGVAQFSPGSVESLETTTRASDHMPDRAGAG